MTIGILFIVLLSGSIVLAAIAAYVDETPTGVKANARRHEAWRQVELNRLRFRVRRDAETTRNEIDRAIERRRNR